MSVTFADVYGTSRTHDSDRPERGCQFERLLTQVHRTDRLSRREPAKHGHWRERPLREGIESRPLLCPPQDSHGTLMTAVVASFDGTRT